MRFPIDTTCYRTFPPEWDGEVFVADIDRTYLMTRFSTLRGLARIPFEQAVDKRDIPGMAALLREIRRGPGSQSRETPLFFVSASPVQLRRVIERKLLLDGIGFDGTIFKDWTRVLRSLRIRRLREQIGFKLSALLANRRNLPTRAREVLIGDDLETDPLAFALYSDLLANRLSREGAQPILRRLGVSRADARGIFELRSRLPDELHVQGAYIRLERTLDPDEFREFGGKIVPCRDAFQLAVALWHGGSISRAGVTRVGSQLRHEGVGAEILRADLRECHRQAIAPRDRLDELGLELSARGLIDGIDRDPGQVDPRWAALQAPDRHDPWTPERVRS